MPPAHWLSEKMAWSGLPLKSQNAEARMHIDTGFLLVKPQTTEEKEGGFPLFMLCIRPFAKIIQNE